MNAESPEAGGRVGHWRQSFRKWRWERPYWAGLLTLLAGLPIAYFPYANLTVGQVTLRMATTAGAGSLIIGVLLVVLGLTMWYQQMVRVFAGVAAILLALVALVVSNFGGFMVGFLLALIGGALALSWAPDAKSVPSEENAPADKGRQEESDDRQTAPEPDFFDGFAANRPTNGRHRAG
jgi:hypothetical protein